MWEKYNIFTSPCLNLHHFDMKLVCSCLERVYVLNFTLHFRKSNCRLFKCTSTCSQKGLMHRITAAFAMSFFAFMPNYRCASLSFLSCTPLLFTLGFSDKGQRSVFNQWQRSWHQAWPYCSTLWPKSGLPWQLLLREKKGAKPGQKKASKSQEQETGQLWQFSILLTTYLHHKHTCMFTRKLYWEFSLNYNKVTCEWMYTWSELIRCRRLLNILCMMRCLIRDWGRVRKTGNACEGGLLDYQVMDHLRAFVNRFIIA